MHIELFGTRGGTILRALHTAACVAVLTIGTYGCGALDKLMSVDARSIIIADSLDNPSQSQLLVTSVQANFECAFGVYIVDFGMLSDELSYYGTSNPMTYWDARFFRDGTGYVGAYGAGACDGQVDNDVYRPLSSARWFADDVIRKLDGWTDAQVPNRGLLIATASAYSGYALVLLGEGFCTGTIDVGPELTDAQLWAEAEARFTRAITLAQAAGNSDILNMALVGRARTRQNLGKLAEAENDAKLVTNGYAKTATASTVSGYRRNRVYEWSNTLRNVGVEGPFRSLTEGGVADARVPSTEIFTPKHMWLQGKYSGLDASIPLASWDEAQLIIAEAEGGLTALNIINMFHTRAGLPAFTDSSNTAIMDHLINEERRRQLFLDSHRIGDMRRYQTPFLPAAGAPYSGGAYSGVYGDTQCGPLPQSEVQSNPNIHR